MYFDDVLDSSDSKWIYSPLTKWLLNTAQLGYDYKEPFKADDTKFLCLKVKAASEGAVSKSNLF